MNLCYIEKSFNHLNLLEKFVKSNVNIMAIKDIEDLRSEEFLIISNEYNDYEESLKKSSNILLWENRWFELDDVMKEESAQIRTNSHNKAIRYKDSYKENIQILNSFVSFCNRRNVIVYLISFPSTRFYQKYLLKEYKESYISALNSIDDKIQFIDFNDLDMFDDKDFLDMDHLEKSGAIKVSEFINNLNL